MGVTYKATDRVLHRPVALKVVQFGNTAGSVDAHHAETLRERFCARRAPPPLCATRIRNVREIGKALGVAYVVEGSLDA
jgi:TolB-like protein